MAKEYKYFSWMSNARRYTAATLCVVGMVAALSRVALLWL